MGDFVLAYHLIRLLLSISEAVAVHKPKVAYQESIITRGPIPQNLWYNFHQLLDI